MTVNNLLTAGESVSKVGVETSTREATDGVGTLCVRTAAAIVGQAFIDICKFVERQRISDRSYATESNTKNTMNVNSFPIH